MTLLAALTATTTANVSTALQNDEARELGLLNLLEPRFERAPRPAARRLVGILGDVFDATLPILTLRTGMPVARAREHLGVCEARAAPQPLRKRSLAV